MFGNNEIVGQKFFKNLKSDELMVTSRFFTLQGEGPYAGQPAYFIRLTKCNLACSFCDTFFDRGEIRTFDQLLAEVDTVIEPFFRSKNLDVPQWAKGFNRQIVLVITGGEPSLQKNLTPFLEKASRYFRRCQIESNGTVVQDYPEDVTLVVSPKCLEKNGVPVRYLEPKEEMLKRADCLKFVVSAPGTCNDAYSGIPTWATEWKAKTGKPIYVSPMNIYNKIPEKAKALRAVDPNASIEVRSEVDERVSFWTPGLLNLEQNERNHKYAAELAMLLGCNLNLQMHLYADLP